MINNIVEVHKQFKDLPFKWGETDCCCFVSRYIELCTGKRLRDRYGDYSTAREALEAQVRVGTFEDTMDGNFKTVDPAMVQRGNVVMFETETGKALGIRVAYGILAMSEEGLTTVQVPALKAWRINV